MANWGQATAPLGAWTRHTPTNRLKGRCDICAPPELCWKLQEVLISDVGFTAAQHAFSHSGQLLWTSADPTNSPLSSGRRRVPAMIRLMIHLTWSTQVKKTWIPPNHPQSPTPHPPCKVIINPGWLHPLRTRQRFLFQDALSKNYWSKLRWELTNLLHLFPMLFFSLECQCQIHRRRWRTGDRTILRKGVVKVTKL